MNKIRFKFKRWRRDSNPRHLVMQPTLRAGPLPTWIRHHWKRHVEDLNLRHQRCSRFQGECLKPLSQHGKLVDVMGFEPTRRLYLMSLRSALLTALSVRETNAHKAHIHSTKVFGSCWGVIGYFLPQYLVLKSNECTQNVAHLHPLSSVFWKISLFCAEKQKN